MSGMTVPGYPWTAGSSDPITVGDVEELRTSLGVDSANPNLFEFGHFHGTHVVEPTPVTIFQLTDFVEQDKLAGVLQVNGHASVTELELYLLLKEHPELHQQYPLIFAMGRSFYPSRRGGSATFANVFDHPSMGRTSGFGLIEVGELRPGEAVAVKPLGS